MNMEFRLSEGQEEGMERKGLRVHEITSEILLRGISNSAPTKTKADEAYDLALKEIEKKGLNPFSDEAMEIVDNYKKRLGVKDIKHTETSKDEDAIFEEFENALK